MSRITQSEAEVGTAIRWYFGGGLGCAIISMAGIGFTHRGLDAAGTTRIGRVSKTRFSYKLDAAQSKLLLQKIMLGSRIAIGITMACLPLAVALNPLKLMATCTALTSFLVIEETYGKMCRTGITQNVVEEPQETMLETPEEEYRFRHSEGEPVMQKEKDL
jgi:hypothetical protein